MPRLNPGNDPERSDDDARLVGLFARTVQCNAEFYALSV